MHDPFFHLRAPVAFRGLKISQKGRCILLLLGCALLIAACADDSLENKAQHHRHQHGGGHGRGGSFGQSEAASPTPAPF